MPRCEPADQRVAQALPRTAPPHARRAPRRHPRRDRPGRRAGHVGKRLSGRLVQRHAAFAGVRLRHARCTGRRPRAAFHVPRHAGRARSLRHRTVLRRSGAALSPPALRLPRPQRLRSGRRQYRRGRESRIPRGPRHGKRAGRAGRERTAVEYGRRPARPPAPRHRHRRDEDQPRQPHGRDLHRHPHSRQPPDRRRKRLHAVRRHPRRRRQQEQPLLQRTAPRTVRPRPRIRPRQDFGQGQHHEEPRNAGHRPRRSLDASWS